ncbi:MAG: complex I NDUFA9 subunit family protein [Proteobacteria bacterium]|nr:complex I NDUFA9 subunit family protein [Burkholderiales bacterium]
MNLNRVCLVGGSGFVGRHIAQRLVARGVRVIIPTRNRERMKADLIVLPSVELMVADVNDPAQLAEAAAGCDALVNLVGVLHQRRAGDFRRAHVGLTGHALAVCQARGIARYLHMSALGADTGAPSEYQRTKGEAEALVAAAQTQGVATTIFRPSVIFGEGDSFLSLFANLLAFAPVVPLGSPDARFQPIWVDDVAHAFVAALDLPDTVGQRYDLVGPDVYTLRELVQLVGRITGHERPIIGLSDRMSYLQARVFELSPIKLITRDNYLSMKVANVSAMAYPALFARTPSALEPIAQQYLGNATPRARYQGFRDRAGR